MLSENISNIKIELSQSHPLEQIPEEKMSIINNFNNFLLGKPFMEDETIPNFFHEAPKSLTQNSKNNLLSMCTQGYTYQGEKKKFENKSTKKSSLLRDSPQRSQKNEKSEKKKGKQGKIRGEERNQLTIVTSDKKINEKIKKEEKMSDSISEKLGPTFKEKKGANRNIITDLIKTEIEEPKNETKTPKIIKKESKNPDNSSQTKIKISMGTLFGGNIPDFPMKALENTSNTSTTKIKEEAQLSFSESEPESHLPQPSSKIINKETSTQEKEKKQQDSSKKKESGLSYKYLFKLEKYSRNKLVLRKYEKKKGVEIKSNSGSEERTKLSVRCGLLNTHTGLNMHRSLAQKKPRSGISVVKQPSTTNTNTTTTSNPQHTHTHKDKDKPSSSLAHKSSKLIHTPSPLTHTDNKQKHSNQTNTTLHHATNKKTDSHKNHVLSTRKRTKPDSHTFNFEFIHLQPKKKFASKDDVLQYINQLNNQCDKLKLFHAFLQNSEHKYHQQMTRFWENVISFLGFFLNLFSLLLFQRLRLKLFKVLSSF